MTGERRTTETAPAPAMTGLILVASESGADPNAVSAAARDALRASDAVLAREDGGITSVLLRGLRLGLDDAAAVEHRIRTSCEAAVGPVRTGLAVEVEAGEPLDLLLRRAHESLAADGLVDTRD